MRLLGEPRKSERKVKRIHRISFCLSDEEKNELESKKAKSGYGELSCYIRDTLLYHKKATVNQIKAKIIVKLSELATRLKEEQGDSREETIALNKMKKIMIDELIELIKVIEQ